MAGLFSMPTPEEVRRNARQQLFQRSLQSSQVPKGRGFVQAASQAGGLFGEAIGRGVGGAPEAEQKAARFQEVQAKIQDEFKSVDLTDPQNQVQMMGRSAQLLNAAGFQEQAAQAMQFANQVRGSLKTVGNQQLEREKLTQRQTEFEFKKEEAAKEAEQLSPTVQKILDKAQTEAIDAGNNAANFDVLASDIEKADFPGGVIASVQETMKNLTGTQDAVSDLRLKYNAVRASQAVTNLPPGPASDKDIALALSGFPKDNAPASQLARFLRGVAKLQRIDEAFLTFKSDLISRKKGTRGLLQKWNEKVASETLGRDVEMSEIYITASNRGLTVQEVKDRLGIK